MQSPTGAAVTYFAHMVHKVPQGVKQALCVSRLGQVCNPHGLRMMCMVFLGFLIDLSVEHSYLFTGEPSARHTCRLSFKPVALQMVHGLTCFNYDDVCILA